MFLLDFIKIPRTILTILAIYPSRESSTVYRIRFVFPLVTNLSLGICLSYHAALQAGDFVRLSVSLNVLITFIQGLTKIFVITYKREDFLKCIDMLETPSFSRYNEQYELMLKQLRNICIGVQIAHIILCNFGLFCYFIDPGFHSSKSLPLDFVHFNSGIFHYPFYIFEVIGMFAGASTNIGMDLLSVGLIMISVTQLRKLTNKLMDMGENVKNLPNYSEKNSEKLTLEYLKDCCTHYSDIEEFSKCLQNCFSIISFSQMVTACVSACNTLILLTAAPLWSAEAMALICYLIFTLAELGLYCWFGKFVSDESSEILTSCYFSSWYECSAPVRRSLFILMERTKRPIEVKALGFITLSLQTLVAILKFTYSYYALLRDISE